MTFEHLDGERFISVRTYRRTGEGVATPVWFAIDGDDLVVGTFGDSGKVRRIRVNPDVDVAPANFRGLEKGEYTPARARIADPAEADRAVAALMAKYEWQWRRFGLPVDTYLVISPRPSS
jgi:PPOX class probable F420-dependent enzyme